MENEYFTEKKEKIVLIPQILNFFRKANPYRSIEKDEDGKVLEPKFYLYYLPFSQWFIDVNLNGALLNFILNLWIGQPIHYVWIMGNGLTLYFLMKVVSITWTEYVAGKIKIVRSMPK